MVYMLFLLFGEPFGGGVDFSHALHRQDVDRLERIAGKGFADHRAHLHKSIVSDFILGGAYSFFTANALL